MKPADLYHVFMKGFKVGASFGALDPKCSEHESEEIRVAYADGWKVGRDARRASSELATRRTGYRPGILRIQEQKGGE